MLYSEFAHVRKTRVSNRVGIGAGQGWALFSEKIHSK